MTPAQWQELERLYHEALARAPEDRAAFVAQASSGDAELRDAVASLLEYEPYARDFIEATPFTPGRHAGSVFGAYALESLIATGGMGEVYRARDTRAGSRRRHQDSAGAFCRRSRPPGSIPA